MSSSITEFTSSHPIFHVSHIYSYISIFIFHHFNQITSSDQKTETSQLVSPAWLTDSTSTSNIRQQFQDAICEDSNTRRVNWRSLKRNGNDDNLNWCRVRCNCFQPEDFAIAISKNGGAYTKISEFCLLHNPALGMPAFPLKESSIKSLKKRLAIEDYSPRRTGVG